MDAPGIARATREKVKHKQILIHDCGILASNVKMEVNDTLNKKDITYLIWSDLTMDRFMKYCEKSFPDFIKEKMWIQFPYTYRFRKLEGHIIQ